ncbi:hypothetical protein Poly24_36040 [Rosistilla carotiformis]|uniref:Uncharacterized protein n=1 Tax=Rosistilla carotiformis TaxID=2528017 RepID=A0A518JWH7_9BACT|nr:hypothetical protein [Rosistilla carotiformis]QDV69886.1 hypothetical protein Poly24_36040 [Rosistilla carotiformis]
MRTLLVCLLVSLVSTSLVAQEVASEISERDQKLAAYLSGSKFIGQFTVIGKADDKMPKEEYTLKTVEKIPGGDLFMITARIKYGDKDVEVPLPIPIVWAGETPMISLDDFTIPGMGTFSAKIVINKGRYAGTWSHDQHGGHMFGVIEKSEASENEASPKTTPDATPPAKPSS